MAHRKLCHGIVMWEGHDGRCACSMGEGWSREECTLLCSLAVLAVSRALLPFSSQPLTLLRLGSKEYHIRNAAATSRFAWTTLWAVTEPSQVLKGIKGNPLWEPFVLVWEVCVPRGSLFYQPSSCWGSNKEHVKGHMSLDASLQCLFGHIVWLWGPGEFADKTAGKGNVQTFAII